METRRSDVVIAKTNLMSSPSKKKSFKEITHVTRERIAAVLRSRFALRIHTSILLLWTFSAGLLTTKGLFALGVHSMFFRYTIAILVAYGAFLLGVRIWLAHVGAGGNARRADNSSSDVSGDLPGFSSSGGGSSGGGSSGTFSGGGGSSGGGGATGSFDGGATPQTNLLSMDSAGASVPVDSGGGFFSSAGGKVGDAVGDIGGGDDGCLIAFAIMIVVGLIALAIGGAFFVISMGPEVLIDAAFNALLSGGLIKAGKRTTDPDWMGSVFKGTWIPLAVVLVAAWSFTATAAVLTPQAHTFGQVWQLVWPMLLGAL